MRKKHVFAFLLALICLIYTITYMTRLSNFTKKSEAMPRHESGVKKHMESAKNADSNTNTLNRLNLALMELDLKDPITKKTSGWTLSARHPNIPIEFLNTTKLHKTLPLLTRISFAGSDWQFQSDFNGSLLYLYSAFYENRETTVLKPSIRIITMSTKPLVPPNLGFCLLWFDRLHPAIPSKIIKSELIDYQGFTDERLMPFLLTCPIPKEHASTPVEAVSVVYRKNAISHNIMKVNGYDDIMLYNTSRNLILRQQLNIGKPDMTKDSAKKQPTNNDLEEFKVGVCGPALFFYQTDYSKTLVEWFEIMKIVGVDKVFLYKTDVHPNIEKVLAFYEDTGFLKITTFNYPPPYTDHPALRKIWTSTERKKIFSLENVYFTDCILRNMYKYNYLSHWDVDEVPVLKNKEVSQFMQMVVRNRTRKKRKQAISSPPAVYKLQWAYFNENLPPGPAAQDIPEDFYLLRHNMRPSKHLKKLTAGLFKSFYDTSVATGAYSHGVLFCNNGECLNKEQQIRPQAGYLAHIRKQCNDECKKSIMEDDYMIKYKEQIITKCQYIWKLLNL